MQQNELAQLLDISPAMVSRLAKRGMPTDDLLRAQRWRKRHLDPGRIKGSRFNPNQPTKPTTTATPAPAAAVLPCTPPAVLDFEIEAAGNLVDAALIVGNLYGAAYRTMELRHLLRQTADDASPRLSLRAWLALLDCTLHETSEIRFAPSMGSLATPGEFGALACPADPWPAHMVLIYSCDIDDEAIHGYQTDDPEWPQILAAERVENKTLRCSRVFGGGGYPLPPE